jgi:hypothetical protein
MFDFLSPKTEGVQGGQGATNPHAGENAGLSAIDMDNTASGAILEEAKATRRTRSDKGVKRSKSGVSKADEEALESLFSPQQWRGLVRAPADAAAAITGSKTWEFSDKETDTLALGAANTARHFATFHPKWLALALFSMSVLSIYGAHFAAYKMEEKRKKAPILHDVVDIDEARKNG